MTWTAIIGLSCGGLCLGVVGGLVAFFALGIRDMLHQRDTA